MNAPAERPTPNLSTSPYLRRGTVRKGEISRGRRPEARALSGPGLVSPAGGGAPRSPALPPLRALRSGGGAANAFWSPPCPPYSFLYFLPTCAGTSPARLPVKVPGLLDGSGRGPEPRPGSGGCGGTAAQGGRPAGPSVSLLVRKHGEIHQSGPKDGVRVPRKGGGRPGIHRGSRRRTRSPDGTEPCQPCPPSSRPETSRFLHSFSPTYLHGSALTLLTTYRGWRGSPADPPGAPSPAVGRGALPRGALRAPPAPRAAAAALPQSPDKRLTW